MNAVSIIRLGPVGYIATGMVLPRTWQYLRDIPFNIGNSLHPI